VWDAFLAVETVVRWVEWMAVAMVATLAVKLVVEKVGGLEY
jgi:hypothetical protein